MWASSYIVRRRLIVYYKPITPTPLSPLLLRGELVRPSVPRLACCPQAPTAWGLFFVRAKKRAPALVRWGSGLENLALLELRNQYR